LGEKEQYNNYSHSVCIVSGVTRSTDDFKYLSGRLHENTMPFYVKDLSILGVLVLTDLVSTRMSFACPGQLYYAYTILVVTALFVDKKH
jgi:hypothetical protein